MKHSIRNKVQVKGDPDINHLLDKRLIIQTRPKVKLFFPAPCPDGKTFE
jgi:hypothetical protein